MSLGKRLLEARKAKGLGGEELGKLAGCSQGAISRWENDLRKPGAIDLGRVAEVLGVREAWLTTGEGPREPQPAPDAPPVGAAALEIVLFSWTWGESTLPGDVDVIEGMVRAEAPEHSTRSASAWRHRIRQLELAQATARVLEPPAEAPPKTTTSSRRRSVRKFR